MAKSRFFGDVKTKAWQPKFPEWAGEQRTRPAASPSFSDDEEGWVAAPSSSHLQSFQYRDARDPKYQLLLKYGGYSVLNVRFKATQTQPACEFEYRFTDHDWGHEIFQAMSKHESPGELLHAFVIAGQIPYRPVA